MRTAASAGAPLRIVGGGTKDFYGQELVGEVFDTASFAGIVDYDPTELVITARSGTRLAEIEQAMDKAGQMLAFEPPHFTAPAGGTLGGCIASGLSGPRRPYAGSMRDLVLGVRLLDGRGEDLSFGGRVMKNVAGFDVSRLIAGSLGTLGIILEVSLKCVPRPRVQTTRTFELGPDEAIRIVNEWAAQPLALSATCYWDARLYARFSGAESAVSHAVEHVGGETLNDGDAFWAALRDQRHPFFAPSDAPLWRLSVRSTAPYEDLGGNQLIEWGGALRWVIGAMDANPNALRAWAREHGGHAALFRGGDKSVGVFQPLDTALAGIHQRLKSTFDPAGILNRGRMYKEW